MSESKTAKTKQLIPTFEEPKKERPKIETVPKFNLENEPKSDNGILKRWEECKFSQKNIHQRSYHSAIIWNDLLYVYGGYELNKGILNDLYCIDLKTDDFFIWKKIDAINNKVIPEALHRHSAVTYQNKMYVYGGKTSILENSNRFYEFDFVNSKWDIISSKKEINQEHSLPFSLDSHNVALYENPETKNTEMIVFGGFIGGVISKYSRSIIYYDFEKKEWNYYYLQQLNKNKKENNQARPKKRSNAAISLFKDKLYIFGGTNGKIKFGDIWRFDLKNRSWFQIILQSNDIIPDARSGHTLVSFENKLILFGGIHDIAHEKNDTFIFLCQEEKWIKLEEDSSKKYETQQDFGRKMVRKKTTVGDDEKSPLLPSRKDKSKFAYKNSGAAEKTHFSKKNIFFRTHRHNSNSPSRRSIFDHAAASYLTKSPKELKEERISKERNMKKMMLLSEFEVSDDHKSFLVNLSPTTEAMKNSINTIKIDGKIDFKNLLDKIKNKDSQRIEEKKLNLIRDKKACARDGCSGVLYHDKIVYFGGDRHKMTFHDMYFFNLKDIEKDLNLK